MPDFNWVVADVNLQKIEIDKGDGSEPELFNAYGTMRLTSDSNEIRSTWVVNKNSSGQLVYEIPWPAWDIPPAITGPEIPGGSEEELGQFALIQIETVNWQQEVDAILPQL